MAISVDECVGGRSCFLVIFGRLLLNEGLFAKGVSPGRSRSEFCEKMDSTSAYKFCCGCLNASSEAALGDESRDRYGFVRWSFRTSEALVAEALLSGASGVKSIATGLFGLIARDGIADVALEPDKTDSVSARY